MGRRAKKAAKRKLEGNDTPELLRKKEAHETLANTIKGLHWRLRKEYRASNEDHDTVWQQHSQDLESLQTYADAMHRLATEHWDEHGQTRIHWCRDTIVEFFLKDGLKLALAKDERRRAFEEERLRQEQSETIYSEDKKTEEGTLLCPEENIPSTNTEFSQNASDHKSEQSSGETTSAVPNNVSPVTCKSNLQLNSEVAGPLVPSPRDEKACSAFVSEQSSGCVPSSDKDQLTDVSVGEHLPEAEGLMVKRGDAEATRQETVISDPFQGRIRLLDVGSCYNPFREFPEFEPIGIDLCPATSTVFQCDFLSLSITCRPSPLSTLSSPVTQLPGGGFHVVVFSLLLEYLPSRLQRWRCCLKAHALLAVNGLLVVVTPDSHSQHRNAPMMKSWKQAIEAIGFRRWRYEKQCHIHCMAFRKTTDKALLQEEGSEKYVEMMYIPQDFKEDADEKPPKKKKTVPKTQVNSSPPKENK